MFELFCFFASITCALTATRISTYLLILVRFLAYAFVVVFCLFLFAFQLQQNKAVEFSKLQICVDLFLFSAQYTDVATVSNLPKFTAGQLFYYPVSLYRRGTCLACAIDVIPCVCCLF